MTLAKTDKRLKATRRQLAGCPPPGTDRRHRGVRDGRRPRLSGRCRSRLDVNDAQSAAVYSDIVVRTLNAAVNQLHVVSARLAR